MVLWTTITETKTYSVSTDEDCETETTEEHPTSTPEAPVTLVQTEERTPSSGDYDNTEISCAPRSTKTTDAESTAVYPPAEGSSGINTSTPGSGTVPTGHSEDTSKETTGSTSTTSTLSSTPDTPVPASTVIADSDGQLSTICTSKILPSNEDSSAVDSTPDTAVNTPISFYSCFNWLWNPKNPKNPKKVSEDAAPDAQGYMTQEEALQNPESYALFALAYWLSTSEKNKEYTFAISEAQLKAKPTEDESGETNDEQSTFEPGLVFRRL
ncbi:hypothetical protein B0T10DRAFT_559427 [Thelonectria olida]|uniref:Uncharacterized protein n=1 Tax=Thelonectria olida TaxID=1576542 RepID=A0A9P8W8Y5_9HYPO|nr:hypothetical protein B0T10DRAFT_559427 [Thelonectria olida]